MPSLAPTSPLKDKDVDIQEASAVELVFSDIDVEDAETRSTVVAGFSFVRELAARLLRRKMGEDSIIDRHIDDLATTIAELLTKKYIHFLTITSDFESWRSNIRSCICAVVSGVVSIMPDSRNGEISSEREIANLVQHINSNIGSVIDSSSSDTQVRQGVASTALAEAL